MHRRINRKRGNKKYSLIRLLILLLLGGLLYFFFFFVPPDTTLSLSFASLPVIYLFILQVFLFIFFLIGTFFKSKRHGVLVGALAVCYLFFRLNRLTSPFFLILLLLLFLLLEMLLAKKGGQDKQQKTISPHI